METDYIVFVKSYIDPVWGLQATPWIHTELVRVTRNRLRKAVFEWVGNSSVKFDLDQIRRLYPIVMYADLKSGRHVLGNMDKTKN